MGFLDEIIETSLKFIGAFPGSINICNTDAFVGWSETIIVFPCLFILLDCCNNILWEEIGSIDYAKNALTYVRVNKFLFFKPY